LAQLRKIGHICAVYIGEWAWKAVGDRLQRPYHLSKVSHYRKIGRRKQRTDIGKYSIVNKTILLWSQLSADALRSHSCKPSNFRKRVRRKINEAKRSCGGNHQEMQ
jgi:hypothetical protein